MHDDRTEAPTRLQMTAGPVPGGASWRFGHSPVGGASEPVPAPGAAGTLPRQGAQEGGAAAEGGPQPVRRRRGKSRVRARTQRRAHSVRLSGPELATVAAGAEAVGMSVAGFLAHSALAAARDLDRTSAAIATRQDALTALFALRRQLGHANNNLNQAAHALNSGTYPDGLEDTIAAVRHAVDAVRHVTARLTDPNSESTAA
ncbi:plasmid mobilization relaxosome protein MobC [Streptomyces sp. NPDC056049]|uniref:plasmid mobilization relaxosome protein MobC n=1 Tax=Streptomyces sp. NPDC056049 TaxID=3345693 RepID=UPI0035E03823